MFASGGRPPSRSYVPAVRVEQRHAQSPPAGGNHRPQKRRRIADDDTDRVTKARTRAEHLTQGDEFLSKRNTQRSSTLVGACLLRAKDLWRLLPPTDSVPEYLLSAFKDLPPQCARRLLPVLIEATNSENKRRTLPLVLALLSPSQGITDFAIPMSVSREIPIGQFNLAPGLPSKQLITQLMSCSLTSLDLSAQMELEDKALLPILRHAPNLKTLILRSCLRIGDPTLQAAAKHCQRLQHLNFNFCPITRSGLAVAMGQLSDLEVLKVASMNGLNDLHVFEMLAVAVDLAAQDRRLPLAKLRSLKLKGTSITEVGLAGVLSHCDQTLESLDISFTPIRTLDLVIVALFGQTTASAFKLKKFAMSGLSLKAGSLKKLFSAISNLPSQATLPLEKLKLGSMGAFLSTSAGNIDYLDSRLLPSLHKALLRCPNIYSCSFAGNERLCNTSGFLGPLLSDLAPKLKFLDLSNTILSNSTTSRLKAADLHGLVESTDGTRHECAIEELRLDGTKVDDEAIEVLQHCKGLRSLHLANATITSEGLALMMANCPNLSILNLSGCRGIPVTMRRNAFQTIDNDMNRNADLQFDKPPASPPKRAKRKARQREYGFFQEYISAEDSDYDPQG